MKTQSQIQFQKYTALKNNLTAEDSDSQDQTNKISQIICDLLPAYYQYRKYMIEILRQSNINQKIYASLFLPQDYLNQKLRKCKEQKNICDQRNKNKTSSKVSRSLITQKILQKQRKKVAEEKQLYQKYEAREIEALIQKQFSSPKFPRPNQGTFFTFEQNKQAHSFQNLNRPVLNQMLLPQFSSSPDAKVNERSESNTKHQKNKKTSIMNKGKQKVFNIKNIINEVKAQIRQQNEKSNESSIGSSKVIQKVQNSNIRANNDVKTHQSENEKQDKAKQKTNQKTKNTKQVTHRISTPKIRINYQSKESSSQSQSSQLESQLDDFISEGSHPDQSRPTNNIVQVEHNADDTYSEHKGARPYLRHNTPNFDTLSQKVRPNNFYEMQRQKLQAQKQKAQKLQNQISVVLGQEPSVVSKKSKSKKQYQELILNDLQTSRQKKLSIPTGRLSSQQIVDQFVFSMRYMLAELCQLYCHSEFYKYLMRNKQYQILKNMYQQQQLGKGPIFAKTTVTKIQQMLKECHKKDCNIIINKIFRNEAFVDFQQFSKAFSTAMMPHEFNLLNSKVTQTNHHDLTQMVSRLFSMWLQMDYFEYKLKKNAQTNSMQKSHLTSRLTKLNDQSKIDLQQTQKFLYSTTKNRTNSLKVRLFLNKYFPSLKITDLMGWLQQKIGFK